MAEETEEKKESQEEKPAGAENTETPSNEPGPIPYDRFKEVNDKAKALQDRLAELEEKQAEREKEEEKKRRKRLEEQQEFKQLAEEAQQKLEQLQPQHDQLQAQLEEYQTLLANYADAQMDVVPELFQDVVRAMELPKRIQWLTENQDKLRKETSKPGGVPSSPPGRQRDDLDETKRRRRAARTF